MAKLVSTPSWLYDSEENKTYAMHAKEQYEWLIRVVRRMPYSRVRPQVRPLQEKGNSVLSGDFNPVETSYMPVKSTTVQQELQGECLHDEKFGWPSLSFRYQSSLGKYISPGYVYCILHS